MVTTFILTVTVILAIIVLGIVICANNSDPLETVGALMGILGSIALAVFVMGAGLGGVFGFTTVTNTEVGSYSKALTTDNTAVVIVVNNTPYYFPQAQIVNNFDKVNKVYEYTEKSFFGCQTKHEIRVAVDGVTNRVVNNTIYIATEAEKNANK